MKRMLVEDGEREDSSWVAVDDLKQAEVGACSHATLPDNSAHAWGGEPSILSR